MLASVAAIVILLFVGSMIRTTIEHDPIRGVGGLRILAEGDELLSFQDFSFGAEGWTPATTTGRLAGLGPVLGPFGADPVQRSFTLPEDLTQVTLSMDVHMVGDWTGPLRISVDGTELLLLSRPDAEAASGDMIVVEVGPHLAGYRPAEMTAHASGLALPSDEISFTRFTVRMNLTVTDGEFTLRIAPVAPPDPASGAVWALDNVTAIAITDGAPVAD